MIRDAKIENIGCWVKNLAAEVTALKNERDSLIERIKSKESKIDGLKYWLANTLAGQKFETPRVAISWRKSLSVEIINPDVIPDDYKDFKTVFSVVKDDIKQAIKMGSDVPGAIVVEKSNIQIK